MGQGKLLQEPMDTIDGINLDGELVSKVTKAKKSKTRRMLTDQEDMSELNRIMCGDFNEIISHRMKSLEVGRGVSPRWYDLDRF